MTDPSRPWSAGTPRVIQAFRDAFSHSTGRDVIVLIDGLGSTALETYRGYIRHLRPLVAGVEHVRSVMPSTTASALTSYFTGVSPLEHGVLGYSSLKGKAVVNQLKGESGIDPESWRLTGTLGEAAAKSGRALWQASPLRYQDSFLSGILNPGWEFSGYRGRSERLDAVRIAVRLAGKRGLTYVHVPDLDKAGHKDGPGSASWLAALEEVDSFVGALMRTLPPGTRLLLSSDHGMINANPSLIDDLAYSPVAHTIRAVAGEGRALMVRFGGEDTLDTLRQWVGERGMVLDRASLIEGGILGPAGCTVDSRLEERLGEALILARGAHQFTDSRYVAAASLAQKGVHGSASEDETLIPLVETVL